MDEYYNYLKRRNQLVDDRIVELKNLLTTPEEWKTAKPIDLKTKLGKIADICHYDRTDKELHNLFKDKGVFLANKTDLVKKVFFFLFRKGYREVVSN